MILLNAEGAVSGRLASFAAKKALQGEEIVIVNAEKAVLTGSKEAAFKKLKTRLDLQSKGNPTIGPKFSKMPDRVLRRTVKGMLPPKSKRGTEALHKIKVFISIPTAYKDKEFTEVKNATDRGIQKHVELGEICKLLGAKW